MLTDSHAKLLSRALENLLGKPEEGSMAFVRCLTGDIIQGLAASSLFAPGGWIVKRVADHDDNNSRTITADRAVELRESKTGATLLLVDTSKAGAGMDGIYSASREVGEASLFEEANALAVRAISKNLTSSHREFAERAVKKARGRGRRNSVSPWSEFDFYAKAAATAKHPGALLHLIGLWPVEDSNGAMEQKSLDVSSLFVNRLLVDTSSMPSPSARIESLRLIDTTPQQQSDLEAYLRWAAARPLAEALSNLADKPSLWVNALRIESSDQVIRDLDLISWKNPKSGGVSKWSGLIENEDPALPPVLMLDPDASKNRNYSTSRVRWRVNPDTLEKGAAQYRVTVKTDMDEELTSQEITHSGKKQQEARFTNDDFDDLADNALLSAKVVVAVIGNDMIKEVESNEFTIRLGDVPDRVKGGVGKTVRAFCEGLIEVGERELATKLANPSIPRSEDSRGFVVLRSVETGKSFRVYRPPLIREAEEQWIDQEGAIGRWRVKVRTSGWRAGPLEFVPFIPPQSDSAACDRTVRASRRFGERLTGNGGAVGQIYDENDFDTVREYLNSWAALLEEVTDPGLSLAHTVEVQSISGKTLGLIVLPTHPLRVAWHAAYDNLVLYARFEQDVQSKEIRQEFKALDGTLFPAYLPGLDGKSTFVFADSLGFHAVAMVLDSDKEPKAAVAQMVKVLGESETADSAPTAGKQSADILGKEIHKYLKCHRSSQLLHIHALRPGDGMTIARSLGYVEREESKRAEEVVKDDDSVSHGPAFVLELYPSDEQQGVAGRFISSTSEKRRSGAGTVGEEDHWMLETLSLEGGISLPRLRWARRSVENPDTPAHVAAAFDTFDSRVVVVPESELPSKRPLSAFGLLAFFERSYATKPSPMWRSWIAPTVEGEKHPSDRTHSERLLRINESLQRAVVRSLGGSAADWPLLRTEIPAEKEDSLRVLHSLCDWVITVDRNAGIEYFDSPRENEEIYDAYVIDCVPEREDLGCLQLITSTSNLDEVRTLLDGALSQMGLSQSLRNAEFLLWHLKALSGRLAIRLTGQVPTTSELIALALLHANCRESDKSSDSWTSLRAGFFIPVDDIIDLVPAVKEVRESEDEQNIRPDLIYVSMTSNGRLVFRFVEVKYRRHLRAARSPQDLDRIAAQTQAMRKRWEHWYFDEIPSGIRALRRAKLARILRFYADKARRHYLDEDCYQAFSSEIDKLVVAGGSYSLGSIARPDRGFVFCPEYNNATPLEISPVDWLTRIYLFGPGRLPNSDFRIASIAQPEEKAQQLSNSLSSNSEQLPDKGGAVGEIVEPPVRDIGQAIQNSEQEHQTAPVSTPLEVHLGTDMLTNSSVRWQPSIRGNPHLMMVGLPGMGKTTCLINICKQLLKQGIRPIIFSYHQDIDEKLQNSLGDIRYIDFNGLGFNPLQVLDRQSRLAYLDVAGAVRDIFSAIFPELGDLQGESIRQALKDSYLEAGWDNPAREDLKEPDFRRFYEILRSKPKADRSLQTLLARLEELADYGFFDVGERRGSLWDSRDIAVIRVHTTQNEILQRAFASLVFYSLYKEMFRRGPQDRLTHAIIFDEAHRASRLKLIPTMAKECRKYGIALVLASQEARDFHVSLYSAIANYLVLRLTDVDAKALARNVSSSDQERSIVDRVKQMDRFRALYFCEGKKKPAYVALAE
jgi:DNA phosphorothioation-dependent restriction protein DptH